jgi:hypothetical protein
LRVRQPVHRNLTPLLNGVGYVRGSTSAVGHLARFFATIHFTGPPPFSVILSNCHGVSILSTRFHGSPWFQWSGRIAHAFVRRTLENTHRTAKKSGSNGSAVEGLLLRSEEGLGTQVKRAGLKPAAARIGCATNRPQGWKISPQSRRVSRECERCAQ